MLNRINLTKRHSLLFAATFCVAIAGSGAAKAIPNAVLVQPATETGVTPIVTVHVSAETLTTLDRLRVNVRVSSPDGRPLEGQVTLSSGSYAAFPVTVHRGFATISVPAGVLQAGEDTLSASFDPFDTAVAHNAAGTATVEVISEIPAPSVIVDSVRYETLGIPFEAVMDNTGKVFVSITDKDSTSITGVQVFQPTSSGLVDHCDDSLRPGLQQSGTAIDGLTLFNHGTHLAAAVENKGMLFYSTADFKNCTAQGTQVKQGAVVKGVGSRTFDSVVTRDGKFAFVANEYGYAPGSSTQGNVSVVALEYDSNGDVSTASHLVGQISNGGQAIAGVLLSADGRRLYITSEINDGSNRAGAGNPYLANTNCVQTPGSTPHLNGILTVVDVAKAETNPSASAIVSTVDAGCAPVRIVETKDESALWVTARGDNRLLAFSPGMLEVDPANALLGHVDHVGSQPVGMTLFHHDQLIAVANSNRFGGGTADAAIVSIKVPAEAKVIKRFPTGLFPREFTRAHDDHTLLLTDYGSNFIQVIKTSVQ